MQEKYKFEVGDNVEFGREHDGLKLLGGVVEHEHAAVLVNDLHDVVR